MPQTITITVPLPPSALTPNCNVSRWPKVKAVELHKTETYWLALQAKGQWIAPTGLSRLSVIMYKGGKRTDKRYRPKDVQNCIASLKACVVGLVMAGLLIDDSEDYLEWGSTRMVKADKAGSRAEVELTLEAIGGEK